MIEPALPVDESERVAMLRDLGLLDTPPEERFDRVTRLAAALFDVPIALVSLVDSNRQWFKSRQGLEAVQTERTVSFCGHAILRPETLVVTDTLTDPRFADNPLVTGPPHIRFYAGRPIAMPGGKRAGTLCIIDRRPRTFDAAALARLNDLACIVEDLIAALELATTDVLTGLANRRGFERIAGNALEIAARHQRQACVMAFRLRTSDTAELKTFGEAMSRVFRKSDVAARRAGPDFVAFLTAVGPSLAPNLVERLRLDLSRSRGALPPVAFDHGLAFRGRAEDVALDALTERAVEDLERRAGRHGPRSA